MIGKLLRAVTGGLLLAGLVHVIAVLEIPEAAPRDAVTRVGAFAGTGRMAILPADGSVVPDLDPFFLHAACAFDLAGGPIAVTADMPEDVWSTAVVTRTGGLIASFERGASAGGRLDLVVGPFPAVDEIRRQRAAAGSGTSVVDAAVDRGFVLIRAFAGDPGARAAAEAALAGATCGSAAPAS